MGVPNGTFAANAGNGEAACLRAFLLLVRPWLFFLAQAVLLDNLAQFLDTLARFRRGDDDVFSGDVELALDRCCLFCLLIA